MQENSIAVREMGILADEVYENDNFVKDHIIENDALQHSYTVIETQNTLLGSSVPEYDGFQALLLKDENNKYTIAFRGTEFAPLKRGQVFRCLLHRKA